MATLDPEPELAQVDDVVGIRRGPAILLIVWAIVMVPLALLVTLQASPLSTRFDPPDSLPGVMCWAAWVILFGPAAMGVTTWVSVRYRARGRPIRWACNKVYRFFCVMGVALGLGLLDSIYIRAVFYCPDGPLVVESLRQSAPFVLTVQLVLIGLCTPLFMNAAIAARHPATTVDATSRHETGKKLDGAYRARLRAALIDQFPSRADLEMLVDASLSVNLDAISLKSNLTEDVSELLRWASIDLQGRLQPLLREAVGKRLNSAELKALQTELFGDLDVESGPPG